MSCFETDILTTVNWTDKIVKAQKSRYKNLEGFVAFIHFTLSSTAFTKKASNKHCSSTTKITSSCNSLRKLYNVLENIRSEIKVLGIWKTKFCGKA